MSDDRPGHPVPYHDTERFDWMRENARQLFNALAELVEHMEANALSAAGSVEALGACIRAKNLIESAPKAEP